MINKNYRKELDGLRGISIIAVVFYHFNIQFFQAGFIGVDIFFVISGYLITKMLIKENFSFLDFYERRIRRLLPALFTLILVISPIFYLVNNDPVSLKNYSLSILSVIFFVSNFFFRAQSGYFDEQSNIKPLLHTWSLSIEEQFYFIFPLIIFLMIRYFKEYLFIFFLLIVIIDIILVQLGGNLTTKFPFIEKDFYFFRESVFFDFFSPLSRIWEFLIGSLASLLLNNHKEKFKNYNIALIGYGLIFASFFIINDLNPYPNIFSLLPVIGTFIVIIYEKNKTISYNFITNKYLVGIGLISYSLYLWHFPILIISQYINQNISYNLIGKLLLIIFSVYISFVSWKYIEKPFRNRKKVNKKRLFTFLLSLVLINLSICAFVYNSDTKKNYLNKYYNKLTFGHSLKKIHLERNDEINNRAEMLKKIRNTKFTITKDKKNILIFGDSHADDLALISKFSSKLNTFYNIKLYSFGIYQFGRKNFDDNKNIKKFLNSRALQNADIIIIADRIYPYKTTTELNWHYDGLSFLIKTIKEKNKKLIFTNNSPVFYGNYEPISTIIYSNKINIEKLDESKINKLVYNLISKKISILNFELKKFSNYNNINLFDKFIFHCDNQNKECEYKTKNNELIFFDNSHITINGAKYIGNKDKFINSLLDIIKN